jgi:DNA modification methylase
MKKIGKLELTRVKIGELNQHPLNPNQGDVGAIVESLEAHGYFRPVLVQKSTMNIIAGNHTVQACKIDGLTEIDVIIHDIDDDQALRIMLADNETANKAQNDPAILTDLLESLIHSEFGLTGTGFTGEDLDDLIAEFKPEPMAEVKEPGEIEPPLDPVTKPGDVWLLGPHRLICGDSRNPTDVEKVLNGAEINLAFTSPPYAEQRTYDSSSGFKPIPPDEYVEWWEPIQENIKEHMADDGSFFVNIKPASRELDTELYVFDLVIAHVRQWGWHFATEFCWERSGVPKMVTQRFKNQFEPIYQFALGKWKIKPKSVQHESENVPTALGKGAGKNTASKKQGLESAVSRNIVEPGMAYPGNRLPTFSGSHTVTGHAAAFPVGLPEFFVKAYTDPHDAVFDPFVGSGSTILAAHNQNRVAYGIELSPAYCDVICNRFQGVTGIAPIHEATGEEVSFVD